MSRTEPNVIVKTRVRRSTRDRLRREAQAANRSLAGHLAWLINQHLDRKGKTE